MLFIPSVVREYFIAATGNVYENILLSLNAIFICYFWLNGTKDITYVVLYYASKKRLFEYARQIARAPEYTGKARVLLVYCTCDDFEESSLQKCLNQTYSRTKLVILDDSSDPGYQARIDHFAKARHIEVVRRKNRKGFKAGNINHYLRGRTDYDYFVILDSDEIIPNDFAAKCLKYFQFYDNVGIVQCNHHATRNINPFMRTFHIGVNSHWLTYQTMKHHYGFMSLLGHGAMVSRKCYEATNGLPEVVAEDLCFSIEARDKGFMVAFAPNIICEEEYPVDYVAFKKRHSKWTQGNFEFMKKYTTKILKANMYWYEKLDIFLFTYNLPLTALFSVYILINIMLLPLLGYDLHYPAWLLIPTVVFFLAPMLNDLISWFQQLKPLKLLKYAMLTFALYGSMLYQSIKVSLLALCGKKAVFVVTPKTSSNITFWEAVKINREEIIFAITLAGVSLLFKNSILPVIFIVIPAFAAVPLTMYSNTRQAKQTG